MELFLGVDVGTKAIKATILNEDGAIVESSNVPIYHLVERPEASWAQRSAPQIWEHVKKGLSQLRACSEIQAVCLDATSGTIVPIDSDGDPLYEFLMYSDERSIKEAQELRRKSARAREFEVYLPIAPYLAIPKIMWLRRNIDFSKVQKVLHESDFISYKLTGQICTSSNVAGKSHADLKGDRYVEEIYEDVKIDVNLLPPIRSIGEVVGTVSGQASEETGLPEGVPVINGLTDGSSGDIATGTLTPGQANATIGTTLILHAVVENPVPDFKRRFYYKTYFVDSFLAGGATNAGTLPLDAIAQLLRLSITELNELARSVPPGCNGLIAQPQWVGTRVPESYPHVKGFFA
ncbi:MAG: FGGY family carbohydrate kinase, partial [Aigarchaeota archaeon]|nr:FGGY family carbohydrate kinase [Aigarchaeota archaeon]